MASAASAASSDDDSATRPSIPPVPETALVADETTRAAVPVGAADVSEASEASNASEEGDTTRAAEVTADYPMPQTPERTQTIPASALPDTDAMPDAESRTRPVDAPSTPAGDSSASPSPARKRNPLAVISVVVLIVLLLAIVTAGILQANGQLPFFNATSAPTTAAHAATATPVPTATPNSDLITFTGAGNLFSIGYPRGWLQTIQNNAATQQNLVIFSNPASGANFNVGTYPGADSPAQQVAENVLQATAQKSPITNRSGPTSVFIGGQSWTEESGDVMVKVGSQTEPSPAHAIAYAIVHNGQTIYMLELAPVDSFTAIQPTFQTMLQTFAFLA